MLRPFGGPRPAPRPWWAGAAAVEGGLGGPTVYELGGRPRRGLALREPAGLAGLQAAGGL